jgi:hypothetical protein
MAIRYDTDRERVIHPAGDYYKVTKDCYEDDILIETKIIHKYPEFEILKLHSRGEGLKWFNDEFELLNTGEIVLYRRLIYDWTPSTGRKKQIYTEIYEKGVIRRKIEFDRDQTSGMRMIAWMNDLSEALVKITHYNRTGREIASNIFEDGSGVYIGYDLDGNINELGRYEKGKRVGYWKRKNSKEVLVRDWDDQVGGVGRIVRKDGLRVWAEYLNDFGFL